MDDWQESVYREHRERLFRMAWLVLRDRQLAEDAVHAAFVKLMRLPEPPPGRAAYVMRSVRNAAIDEMRRRDRRHEHGVENADVMSDLSRRPDELMLEEELLRLSASQRDVIEMKLRLGLSFREISELISEPMSTVSSRYQRAIEAMRQRLEVTDERA